jgi:hypothetical protein
MPRVVCEYAGLLLIVVWIYGLNISQIGRMMSVWKGRIRNLSVELVVAFEPAV